MSHMNESCHIWISHVTYEWVMSYMNVIYVHTHTSAYHYAPPSAHRPLLYCIFVSFFFHVPSLPLYYIVSLSLFFLHFFSLPLSNLLYCIFVAVFFHFFSLPLHSIVLYVCLFPFPLFLSSSHSLSFSRSFLSFLSCACSLSLSPFSHSFLTTVELGMSIHAHTFAYHHAPPSAHLPLPNPWTLSADHPLMKIYQKSACHEVYSIKWL